MDLYLSSIHIVVHIGYPLFSFSKTLSDFAQSQTWSTDTSAVLIQENYSNILILQKL